MLTPLQAVCLSVLVALALLLMRQTLAQFVREVLRRGDEVARGEAVSTGQAATGWASPRRQPDLADPVTPPRRPTYGATYGAMSPTAEGAALPFLLESPRVPPMGSPLVSPLAMVSPMEPASPVDLAALFAVAAASPPPLADVESPVANLDALAATQPTANWGVPPAQTASVWSSGDVETIRAMLRGQAQHMPLLPSYVPSTDSPASTGGTVRFVHCEDDDAPEAQFGKKGTCVLCLHEETSYVYVACGHACLCQTCAERVRREMRVQAAMRERMRRCPVCRCS